MNTRTVAGIPRGLGGWLAGAAVAAILVGLAPAQALGSSETSLGMRMTRISTGRPTLVVRGGSVDATPPGEYTTTASPLRIPCPGRYRYQAETENQLSGASSSYTAVVALSHLSTRPEGLSCGDVPPPRAGEVTIAIVGASEPFHLTGSRGGFGAFLGNLYLRSQPECDESYTFTTELALRGWHRSFSYHLEVDKVEFTLEGVTHSTRVCGE